MPTRSPFISVAILQLPRCRRRQAFRAAYEIYAHVRVAELGGLSDDKLATIVAGQRPADLSREEAIAYDVSSSLVSGGVLPALTYEQSLRTFGDQGTAELISLVGLYCMVAVLLNF
jgi:4-carboxymuconolactone decarboxylase